MEIIAIGGTDYDSYRTVAQADTYLAAALHASTDWSGAATLAKQQALVTASRILDRQRWLDAYDTQAERIAIQNVLDACCEMALALVQGSELQSEQSTAQKLQSIKAGPVALTYFRGAEGRAYRFPTIVHELLRDYVEGANLAVLPKALGTGGESSTKDDFGHTGGL